ncbi:hypothetical protein [Pseudalkalibacillus sp. SCS-8]|uniref:hypothetical protein n=1 Tax=Pseudalkalibacillus nanhaiensis TaxID=3115291 RepID=UPI0032DBBB8D
MKKNMDLKHEEYLKILDNISLKELENINIRSILYNDIWFSFNMTYSFIIKQILSRLFTIYFSISRKNGNSEKNLLFTIIYNRQDHDAYWNIFKEVVGNYQEVKMIYNRGKRKINKNFIIDIAKFVKIFMVLKHIRLFKSRLWFTLQILNAIKIKRFIENMNIKCNVLYTFYDGGFEGNILSQYFKIQGATTVTLQHGQCLYRDRTKDRINQSVILNFISDYCICKGDFAKRQFIKAGVSADRILPLGNLECLKESFKKDMNNQENNNKLFCVFLDTPSYPFYEDSTEKLVNIANDFSKKYGYKYYLKPHPADNKMIFKKYINNSYCQKILEKNYTIDYIKHYVDFSIFHASAIYADMLLKKMKSYKLKTDVDFNIVLNERDLFENTNQLIDRVSNWGKLNLDEKEKYFEIQNHLYSNPNKVKERYLDFINSLE